MAQQPSLSWVGLVRRRQRELGMANRRQLVKSLHRPCPSSNATSTPSLSFRLSSVLLPTLLLSWRKSRYPWILTMTRRCTR